MGCTTCFAAARGRRVRCGGEPSSFVDGLDCSVVSCGTLARVCNCGECAAVVHLMRGFVRYTLFWHGRALRRVSRARLGHTVTEASGVVTARWHFRSSPGPELLFSTLLLHRRSRIRM